MTVLRDSDFWWFLARAAAVVILIVFSIFMTIITFDECLTDHPWWYCLK